MAFSVAIQMQKEFNVPADYDKVFDVLSNVPVSVSHFPTVEQLVDMGNNTFRWEMEKIGVDKYYLQTIYACKYIDNRKEGWVKWEPVKGVGNGLLEGSWKISSTSDGTNIKFNTKGELSVPLTSLIKILISPIVVKKFETLVDQYIENLKQTFGA